MAVAGMIGMTPLAPAELRAWSLKFDSTLATASARATGTLPFKLASSETIFMTSSLVAAADACPKAMIPSKARVPTRAPWASLFAVREIVIILSSHPFSHFASVVRKTWCLQAPDWSMEWTGKKNDVAAPAS
jgi:hypothetical protein